MSIGLIWIVNRIPTGLTATSLCRICSAHLPEQAVSGNMWWKPVSGDILTQLDEGKIGVHKPSGELVHGTEPEDRPGYKYCEMRLHFDEKQDRKFIKIDGFGNNYYLLPSDIEALLNMCHAYRKEVKISFFHVLMKAKELNLFKFEFEQFEFENILFNVFSNKSYNDKTADVHDYNVTIYGTATNNHNESGIKSISKNSVLEDTDNGVNCVAACATKTAAAEQSTDDGVLETDASVPAVRVFENSDVLNSGRLSTPPVQCTDMERAPISHVSEQNCYMDSTLHSSETPLNKHICVSSSNVDTQQSPSCEKLDRTVMADGTVSEEHHTLEQCLVEVDAVSKKKRVPFEVMELILLKASHFLVKRAWSDKVQDPVQAPLISLSSTCWDWYNVICQPRFSHLLLNRIRHFDPYLLYSNNPSLLSVVHGESDINGIAICRDQLYMISISSPMIDIYDAQKFNLERSLNVPNMEDPWDIAACEHTECLYIFEGQCEVLCLDLQGNMRSRWLIDADPSGLSVTQKGLVLITYSNKLVKYSAAGDELQTINFADDISYASQAVYLNNSLFVCNGGGRSTVTHMICSVGDDGRSTKRHTETTGSLYQPVHMSLADHGCVLVADINGQRIQILNKNLDQIISLIVDRHENDWPLRICYDKKRGQLFVNTLNGQVLVYHILDRNVCLLNGHVLQN